MASGKKIVIYSTSDGQEGSLYDKMLDETSKLNQYYADKHSHTYKTFKGLKKGVKASNALYNKVFLAKEEFDSGEFDWFVYLDADSYIIREDDDFIDILITSNLDKLIMRGIIGDGPWAWSVPLFINLKHEYTDTLLQGWINKITEYCDSDLLGLLTLIEKQTFGYYDRDFMYSFLRDDKDEGLALDAQLNNSPWEQYLNANQYLIPDRYVCYEDSIFIQHYHASTDTSMKLNIIKDKIEDKLLSLEWPFDKTFGGES